jgi:superfamily II DNA or RNA helicase
MTRLEDLRRGATVRGILPNGTITVVDAHWHGSDTLELFYRDGNGRVDSQLLFRDAETQLELVTEGRPWSFDADGHLLRLVSEAQRIRLAHLSDPYLAVHTSDVEPLPHQITAVYEKMLPRQPLRFLLADDPGAGKTIMAGLLIKELRTRGDLQRCLIVCPGSLVVQWQEELCHRFGIRFDILTRDSAEQAATGNIFAERPLVIARLDQLARNEDLQRKLEQVDWDLIVCDEAHKMSASFFGGEIQYTKRYRLGQLLGQNTRHLLLMTATPHNGKEEDFQLFMALLDGDRFEGRFRDGVHTVDVSDMMRRMVKEQLLRFDATPLFPERRAYTVLFELSDAEAHLYQQVTEYVREEFNRAEALQNNGRVGTVGFALTILQRRLASSPEAIYQSLRRRRERLESRLRELELLARGRSVAQPRLSIEEFRDEDWDDLDDAPAEEVEQIEEEVVDLATAARTIEELRAEIMSLKRLEELANGVRRSGTDRKWDELRRLLLDEQAMFDSSGRRKKLVIFTEHRDTLNYLADRIRALLGRPESVVTIHGGILREERAKAQAVFTQDKDVFILVATDAAGEGINLQRAHLMINYDLPWNPNRLEQRFGRIHRIGQEEVCHLWNLVARETREGDVYATLLRKLEAERDALGGAVFDVLDRAISGRELRELMIEAIRYGDQPDTRARLTRKVEGALDRDRLRALMREHVLVHEVMDPAQVFAIRHEMERMEARRLQPHYIASFFKAAFEQLGGTLHERERNRYEVTHVPAVIRQRDRQIGQGTPVLRRYERICFEKTLRSMPGKPQATFVSPGHPLLNAVVNLTLERYRDVMRQGAILVDENDLGEQARALFYLEHAIRDGLPAADGSRREISKRLLFVEMKLESENPAAEHAEPVCYNAGYAPYLDYRPLRADERALVEPVVERLLASQDLEQAAVQYAIRHIVPDHLVEVRNQREPLIDKTYAAVKERLTKEIIHWDNEYIRLRELERMGRVNARLNSTRALQRKQDLELRLKTRLEELELERRISAQAPNVAGGALVLPIGLIRRLAGLPPDEATVLELRNKYVEMAAMHAVMAAEKDQGYMPRPVYRSSSYDIESVSPTPEAPLRIIEVKGFTDGSADVTLTANEIRHALNKRDAWLLALVRVPKDESVSGYALQRSLDAGEIRREVAARCEVRYVRCWLEHPPHFGSTGERFSIDALWARGVAHDSR